MEYDKMLTRLYGSLPEKSISKERFELPKLDSTVQGKKTIIKNFSQAIKSVKRDEKAFYKYITKETATAGVLADGKLTLTGKFWPEVLEKLFNNYLKEYVLCHECGKPDTEIAERSGVKMLKCTACGALSPLKKIR
ncbi:MAG: translation initiation factor IF-2 subunit beta [Candidatus Diapherotrites archaeon]|uniref:Translation initiation factor 2 subunit beta n=1 Tax=Candidatus Iainarchaeum sp. TaxID=3101447 RepID=A0A2D6LPN5_9ARCH|nr:translation initiation factor IF-2 subunit beta [Candidatus Diapherotrites archaeon]|tara:strand:- start:9562 stop:9969 length:408 start_codon:yes stop_codon:yes gene_type:complete